MDSSSHTIGARNRKLAEKLLHLTSRTRPPDLHEADTIVSHIEVNDHHGVGVLIRRLFGASDNILSIRSRDFYQGHQEFGARHLCVSHGEASRDRIFWNILEALRGVTVKRVICVPYFTDDAVNAIALKTIFGVPLCTYIMDDQNLCADGIPDSVMEELLAASSLRLAISAQLREGYQQKYGHKFWYLPPLAPHEFIPTSPSSQRDSAVVSRDGVIVGNIWGQRWVELLRRTVRGSGIHLRWFNHGEFRWVPCNRDDLARDGVVQQEGTTTDAELIGILRGVPFVVIPSGILDQTDDRRFIAQLSLPSRIPYIFGTSQAPILVLGSPKTAAARFVVNAGIGMVVPYRREAFQEAVRMITHPVVNAQMRQAAFQLAARYSDLGAAEWIWESLEKGEPADLRFESLMPDPGWRLEL